MGVLMSCRRATVRVVGGVLFLTLGFTGCGTLDSVMSDAFGAALARPTEAMMGRLMSGWTDAMMFQLTYLQVFLLGGYGVGLEDFNEGEGVTWEVVSADGTDRSVFIAERALLRRNPDNTAWWYLGYQTTEDGKQVKLEYEARLDSEHRALEIYLRDPETGQIRHHVLDQPDAAPDEQWDELEYEDDHVVWDEDIEQLRRERVRITVRAGTFDTDYVVYEFVDEETGERAEYRWWSTDQVPGQLVQYEWVGTANDGTVRGELIEIRRDYRTRFNAY
jgi:hypothetical protein